MSPHRQTEIFSALADPTRLTIMRMLAEQGKLPASAIYDQFPMSHPAVSQHLKRLQHADLVTVEKKAQQRVYRLNPVTLTETDEWIKEINREWNKRLDALEKALENKKPKLIKNKSVHTRRKDYSYG